MRGDTTCTVAPCSVSQRIEPVISTSSTPFVQQIAMVFPLRSPGFDGGSKRKWYSSRFRSPSAVTRSSVEIDGTGEEVIKSLERRSAAERDDAESWSESIGLPKMILKSEQCHSTRPLASLGARSWQAVLWGAQERASRMCPTE